MLKDVLFRTFAEGGSCMCRPNMHICNLAICRQVLPSVTAGRAGSSGLLTESLQTPYAAPRWTCS